MGNARVADAAGILRALLTDDFDTFRRLHGQMDTARRQAFAVVLTAAFHEAVLARFGEEENLSAIIEFVADSRTRYARTGQAVPADNAEAVIRAAITATPVPGLDARARGEAQTAMLYALTHETGPIGVRVDALLDDASAQADEYFARKDAL